MRIIDADALLAELNDTKYTWQDYDAVEGALRSIPAVDAVEVVRCKDCKHGEIDDPDFPYQYYCRMGHMWNDAYYFCVDGDRKGCTD